MLKHIQEIFKKVFNFSKLGSLSLILPWGLDLLPLEPSTKGPKPTLT